MGSQCFQGVSGRRQVWGLRPKIINRGQYIALDYSRWAGLRHSNNNLQILVDDQSYFFFTLHAPGRSVGGRGAGKMTCPRSHDWSGAEVGLEPPNFYWAFYFHSPWLKPCGSGLSQNLWQLRKTSVLPDFRGQFRTGLQGNLSLLYP